MEGGGKGQPIEVSSQQENHRNTTESTDSPKCLAHLFETFAHVNFATNTLCIKDSVSFNEGSTSCLSFRGDNSEMGHISQEPLNKKSLNLHASFLMYENGWWGWGGG